MDKSNRVILIGEKIHPMWKWDLESETRVAGCWRHINGTAIEPSHLGNKLSTVSTEDLVVKLEAFDIVKSTAMSMIIKRCEITHQCSIRMIENPKDARKKLNIKYKGENHSRLMVLCERMLNNLTLKNVDVDTKADQS